MRPLLFSTLILSATLDSSALAAPSALKDRQFIIEKERKLPLPEANRLFENAPVPPRTTVAPVLPLQYRFRTITPTWDLLPRRTKLLRARNDAAKRLYGNYVLAGYGNFYAPYLEAFFDANRSERYAYGVRCKHLSAGREGHAEESHNTLEAHGKVFLERLWLGGRVCYDRCGYPLYQPPPATTPALHHVVHLLTVCPVLTQRRQGPLSYRLQGGFDYLRDGQRVQEYQLGLLGWGGYALNKLLMLKTTAALHWTVHRQAVDTYRHLCRLRPVLVLAVDEFELQAGASVVYQNDVCDAVRPFSIYPVLEAQYGLRPWLRPYVGVGGGVQRTSRMGFVQQNPRLAADVELLHTQRRATFYGGARGEVPGGVAFHGGAALELYRNLPHFVNHKDDPGRFALRYIPASTVLNVFGEVTHTSPAETWISRLRADYFNYYSHRPWHRPQYQLDLTSAYRFQDKLVLKGAVCWMGDMAAWDVRRGVAHGLADVVDVGLGVDYWWSSRLFVFLNCENLLGRANERFWHYPSRGVHFSLGLAYAW